MKHFLLKFNHGVEIGARLAYLGHYARTGDKNIFCIANDELNHKQNLEIILRHYDSKPSRFIDGFFTIVGKTIQYLCHVSPLSLLDFIARTMETFAISNYSSLAERYPTFKVCLVEMGLREIKHREYFKYKKETVVSPHITLGNDLK